MGIYWWKANTVAVEQICILTTIYYKGYDVCGFIKWVNLFKNFYSSILKFLEKIHSAFLHCNQYDLDVLISFKFNNLTI